MGFAALYPSYVAMLWIVIGYLSSPAFGSVGVIDSIAP